MRALSLLVVLSACGPQGGKVCHAMGVYDGLNIDTKAARWDPGEYTFTFDDGELSATCTVILPTHDPHGACPEYQLRVDDDGSAVRSFFLTDMLGAQVAATVARDGALLTEQVLAPTYTIHEYNGEGCGETEHGEAELSW